MKSIIDEQILSLLRAKDRGYAGGLNTGQIARKLGRTRNTINQHLVVLELQGFAESHRPHRTQRSDGAPSGTALWFRRDHGNA